MCKRVIEKKSERIGLHFLLLFLPTYFHRALVFVFRCLTKQNRTSDTFLLAEYFVILCTGIYCNIRSCHLRLTLGRAPSMHTHNRNIEKSSGRPTQFNI
jgi:hypothetical protein